MRQVIKITGLIGLAVVVIAWFLVRIGVENVVGSGQAHTEKTAVSTLRTLHWAQGLFRQGGYLDTDGDRIGEFGTLSQLSLREKVAGLEVSLVPEAGTRIEGELLQALGFCFRLDLPQGADARERNFVAYAWPSVPGAGHKVFCLDQDENILQSGAEGWVGCDKGPPVGACPSPDALPAGWSRWKNKTSVNPVGALD